MSQHASAEIALMPMSEVEARRTVDQINGHLDSARKLIYELWRREGWKALGYGSWRECILAEFQEAQSQLYRQLDAARVEAIVSPVGEIGSIPERQLRPLAPLRDRPDELREAWASAVEHGNGQPTGRDVQEAVDVVIARRDPLPGQVEMFVGRVEVGEAQSEPASATPSTPQPVPWTPSEVERRKQVELGYAVVASMKGDLRLIAWAESEGRYVRIDRATVWGNPFVLNDDGDRDTICESYRAYLQLKPSLGRRFGDLQGKVLGCWCYPERCHGNILIEESAE